LHSLGVTKLRYFDVNPADSFAADEIARARAYHRPLYLALLLDWTLQLLVLVAFAFTRAGDWLWDASGGPPGGGGRGVGALGAGDWLWDASGGPWWARVLEVVALVVGISTVVRLPLSLWRGWIWERRWDFSTQSLGSWFTDVLKGLALGIVLTGLALTGLVWSARSWPSWLPGGGGPRARAP